MLREQSAPAVDDLGQQARETEHLLRTRSKSRSGAVSQTLWSHNRRSTRFHIHTTGHYSVALAHWLRRWRQRWQRWHVRQCCLRRAPPATGWCPRSSRSQTRAACSACQSPGRCSPWSPQPAPAARTAHVSGQDSTAFGIAQMQSLSARGGAGGPGSQGGTMHTMGTLWQEHSGHVA